MIFIGTGQSFRPGFDPTAFLDQNRTGTAARGPQQASARLFDRLEDLPMPIPCTIDGGVFGGTPDLAVGGDFPFAATGARMRMPAGALGSHFCPTGLRRHVTRFGLMPASEECADAERRDPHLVDRLVAPEDLPGETTTLAGRLIGNAPKAHAGI